jgi:hypothetical protein
LEFIGKHIKIPTRYFLVGTGYAFSVVIDFVVFVVYAFVVLVFDTNVIFSAFVRIVIEDRNTLDPMINEEPSNCQVADSIDSSKCVEQSQQHIFPFD